jgi:hypothetical protein
MKSPKIISRTLASRTPSDAVKRRESLFEQASEVAFRAVLAISQDNEQQARSATDELRFLKRLIRNGEPLQSGPEDISSASPLSLQLMRLAFDAIAESDVVIQHWVHQNQLNLVCCSEQTDPKAWQRMIDAALPDAWSFDTDVFLIFGNPPTALISALCLRGQRRIVVLTNGLNKVVAKPGTELLVSNDPTAVTAFIRSMHKPIPKTHAKICMRDSVDEDMQDRETENAILEEQIHKALMSNWMDSNTIRHFAQHWVQQGVANIPAIAYHENLHALDDQFHDRPAILIAPGPSLDKNIGLLHQAKGKAVLIAPLQSLRRLYKAGIQPDFITVLDATDLTTEPFDFFNDVPDDFLTTLIVGVNCHPNVIRRFQHVYFFSGGGTLDRWVQDVVPQPLINMDASSVALTGLLLAEHWGCNPITLVGQDLALAGNRRYADDAQLNNLTVPLLMTLPGYYGGTVQSPSDYFLFHHQFEKIAEKIASLKPETRLFNSTEGGAFIKGFLHEPLHQVLEQHVVGLPVQPIAKTPVGSSHLAGDRLVTARVRLQTACRILEDLQQQVTQLVRLSQQLRPQAAMIRKLSDKEQMLRKQLKRIEGFTSIYQDDIDQAVVTAAKAKTLRENLVASQALYQVVADSCQFFRPLVEDALVALDALQTWPFAADVGQEDVALLV